MYVVNAYDYTIPVIDTSTNTVIATIGVGANPQDVAYDSNDGRVYVDNDVDNTVSVIATSQYPHHTTITSAVDDNGNPVQNKSSTLSTTITFNVRVIPGVYPKPASSAALITVLSLPVVLRLLIIQVL